MSGVRCGTRLEQLLDLRRQVNLQIELEVRNDPREAARLGLTGGGDTPPRARQKSPGQSLNVAERRLAELGVSSTDVKAWAVQQGLLPEVKRGRIGINLVEQYAAAHAAPELSGSDA